MPLVLFSDQKIGDILLQGTTIDTLQEIERLNNLAIEFIDLSPDTALEIAQKSLSLCLILENDTLRARTEYVMGKILLYKGQLEEALTYFVKSMNVFKRRQILDDYLMSLSNLPTVYFGLLDYNNALESYREIYEISTRTRDDRWIAFSLDGIGSVYYLKGEYEKALESLFKSFKLYKDLDDKQNIVRLLYILGATNTALSKYDHAIDYLLNSLEKSIAFGNQEYEAWSTHAIGIIYQRLQNYNEAIRYSKRALKTAQKINDKYYIGIILNQIGDIYFHLAEYDSAWSYLEKSLEVHRAKNNKVGIANVLDLLGEIHYQNKDYIRALDSYKKAWETILNVEEKYRKTKITNHIGIVYTQLRKYNLAYQYLSKANRMAKDVKAQDLIQENLNAISDYYAAVNNYGQAYHYLSDFAELRDSIFTASSHHIAEMQMRYETEKREKENELLRNEIEIQKLALDKEHLKIWVAYLSLAIVSIISFFSYSRYRAKRRINIRLEETIEKALQKQKEQQEIIFHQANLTSLGELAAGMAHEINQPLQDIQLCTESLSLRIKELYPGDCAMQNDISEIYLDIDRIRNIVTHVRVFSSQQKNHINEYFTTNQVINNALSLVGKQYLKKGIKINLKLKKGIGYLKGNPYRVEQILINLLSNAKDALLEKQNKKKEAFEKIINIYTNTNNNNIILKIEDNGIGMKLDQKKNIFRPFFTTKKLGEGTGLGLSIVFGIVKDMNGSITVNSEIQKGTMVELKFPKAIKKTKGKK